MLRTLALGRLWQKDHKFEVSVGYTVRSSLKINKRDNKVNREKNENK
jgi:hypothetical protein